jgi:hypothetical protein
MDINYTGGYYSNQNIIFQKVKSSLKIDGYFLGDTPANPTKDNKMLKPHENEWTDEAEMRNQLQPFFSNLKTQTLVSKDRTNLFWCCQ